MEKWFFSNNGKVTAPFDLEAAKEYLASNPDVYGWHPSFNQWKPVNCISEFVGVLPPTVQSPLIPKEISDKFTAKKNRLQTKLNSIDDSINHSQSTLAKFENQIEFYKELTKNLNDDVKGAIENIEKKYKSLSRKLSQVKDAVHIAENEMSEVVDDFDHRMSSNDIFMPSCTQSIKPAEVADISDAAQISKAKLAQEKLATPHKRIEPVQQPRVEKQQPPKKSTAQKPASKPPVNEAHDENEGFNGVKNMMKSVFKGDSKVDNKSKVEVKKGKDEPLSMAERLKLAQNNQ